MIFQAGHRNGFAHGSSCEKTFEQRLLVRLELRPFGAILLHDEVVILVVHEPEHALFLMFLDNDVAANGKVDDGCGDVAHVSGIIYERTYFSGREMVRWLILRGDGSKARVAPACPPQIEHHNKCGDWDAQRPIAAQEQSKLI